jgi:hypothetical protein
VDPVRDRDRADPPTLAGDVDEDRPAVPLLEVRHRQAHELTPTQCAADEDGQDSPVAPAFDGGRVRSLQEGCRFFRGRPLPHPDPQAPHASDAGDPSGDRRVHPPVLGRFGRQLPQGGQAEVDGGGGEAGRFHVGAELLEGGAGEGAGAEKGQEVVEGLAVGSPRVLGRHGVQDQCLEAGNTLARAAAGGFLPFWAPFGAWNEVGHLRFPPPSRGPRGPRPAPSVINDSPAAGGQVTIITVIVSQDSEIREEDRCPHSLTFCVTVQLRYGDPGSTMATKTSRPRANGKYRGLGASPHPGNPQQLETVRDATRSSPSWRPRGVASPTRPRRSVRGTFATRSTRRGASKKPGAFQDRPGGANPRRATGQDRSITGSAESGICSRPGPPLPSSRRPPRHSPTTRMTNVLGSAGGRGWGRSAVGGGGGPNCAVARKI